MGEKKSGGGWLKKIPGLGRMASEQKSTAKDRAASQQEKPTTPARKLHRNPLMPGRGSAAAQQPATGGSEQSRPDLTDTILVIDDSEIDRMIIEELLTDAGYAVIQAVDGKDGIAKFRECFPSLVITDMIMPGMNGTEVILKVRAESPETRIIALSAGGELGPSVALTVPKSLQIETLHKPVDPDVLLAAVKAHFK